ncbi:MAG: hypothetical protein VB100_11345 [Angelakisella sp.]|nr:hypothetical protein [Angelakisella sp.]
MVISNNHGSMYGDEHLSYEDIPLGLGMSLAQNLDAMTNFGRLSKEQQQKIIAYVQCGATGEETKARIENAVSCLSAGSYDFVSM